MANARSRGGINSSLTSKVHTMNIVVTLLVAMGGGSSAAAFTSRPVQQTTITSITPQYMSSLNNDGYNYSSGQNNYRSKSNGIYNGDYSGDDYLRNRNGAYGNNNWGRNNKWDRNNSWGSNSRNRGGVSSGGLRRYQPEFQDYNGYGSRGGGRGLSRQISSDYGYDNYSYDPYYYGDSYQSPINYGYSPYNRQGSSEDFRRVSNNDRYRRRDNNFRLPSYDSSGGRGYALESRTFGGRTTPYGSSYGRQLGGNYASEGFRQGNSVNRIQDYLTPREREMSQQRQNFGARYGFQQQYDVNRGNVRGGSSNDFRRGRAFDRYQDFQTPRYVPTLGAVFDVSSVRMMYKNLHLFDPLTGNVKCSKCVIIAL